MNKLFQITLLTAALSTCSSHAVIRHANKVLGRLIPLFTSTHLKAANPTIPPKRCFPRKKPGEFAAEIVTSTWLTFKTREEGKKILGRIQQKCGTQMKSDTKINWFEKK